MVARIESLILEKGMDDALCRADAYVKAGADAVMIHSRKKSPEEIKLFCNLFRTRNKTTPIVLVPTSYSSVTEQEIKDMGANIVIYANHLLRASYPAMRDTARMILEKERCYESEQQLLSIKEILELIPGTI